MFPDPQNELREKLALIWAERRKAVLTVRIYYDVREEDGCTLYRLHRVERLD
ncbi:MAG: hypothetical protein ACE15B_10425 [Bryobacteraceae bacterium]